MADILGERARLTPQAEALVVIGSEPPGSELPGSVPQGASRFTYQELDERATRCARLWMETLGLTQGDRVGILSHNRVEYLDAFFAAGKCGVVLVTLGTRLTAHELTHVVQDSGLSALIYDGAGASTVAELRSQVEVARYVALDVPLDTDPESAGDVSYSDAVAALEDVPWRPTSCDPDDVYCLLYTSGTTGKPKGVMIPHRQVLANGYQTVCNWQLRGDDVTSIFTPLYHAGGLMAFLVPLVVIGGRIVLHREFDAAEIWRAVEEEGCTVILGVPTIWKMLLEAPSFASTDLSSVRWLISGGAPLPQYLIEAYQARDIVFKQGFGMTEVGVNCFAMTVEDSFQKIGSIGKPMMHTEVRLVDSDGQDVAPGEVGELLFRGQHVCLGYWNNPQATAKSLGDDGWFHSGDQARCDEDGYYYVAGRQKDMIISGGVNVYPAEIEAQLVQHSGVEDAAVVAIPHDQWGEVGVAFVVPRSPGGLQAQELGEFLEPRLARFKIPKDFVVLDDLPRTAYGKVVKGDLREQYVQSLEQTAQETV